MRAQEELELEPHRVVGADVLPVIEVVLEAQFGELARIPREVRRKPPATCPREVPPHFLPIPYPAGGLIMAALASHVVKPESRHPAFSKSVRELGVETVVQQGLAPEAHRQPGSRVQ